MKLTKRILCLTTAIALLLALCACGNKKDNNADSTPSTTTTTNAMGGNLDSDNVYNDGVLSWD